MSKKLSSPKQCPNCKKICLWFTGDICHNCYRREKWKQKNIICKRCGRQKPNQAKGYCAGCYNYVFHLENTKAHNYKKWYNVDIDTYNRITKTCLICGFDKVIQLHHLDHNHKNNQEDNLIGLCPTHHKMLHDFQYRDEIKKQIKEKLDLRNSPLTQTTKASIDEPQTPTD
ncbi:MAG: hypothetical protein AABW67_04025 [Nanoarchaeota archaeon]